MHPVRQFRAVFAALSFILTVLSAQAETVSGSDFLFKNIGLEQGLSAREVYAVEQDAEGYMWFGTEDGLNRYDGYDIRIFRHDESDSSSLSHSKVNCLLCDSEGRLWVGTNKGLNLYHPSDGTFSIPAFSSDMKRILAEAPIRTLYEDSEGRVWAGTMNGLFCLDLHKNELLHYSFKGMEGSRNRGIVRSVLEDHSGNFWVGTFDGLFRLDGRTGEIRQVDVRKLRPYAPENNLILSLMLDPGDRDALWVGSETGLHRLDMRDESYVTYTKEDAASGLSNNVIKCLQCVRSGHIIAGTDDGLNVFDSKSGESKVFLHDIYKKTSIANNVVWDMARDQAGHYWFATDNGVSQVVSSGLDLTFHKVDRPDPDRPTPDNLVVDIAFDREGGRYIALENRLFYEDVSGHRVFYDFAGYSDLKFRRIMVDGRGVVWAGTLNSLWYKEPASKDFQRIANLNLRYVNYLVEDQDGNLWVEGVSGSCRISVGYDDRGRILDLDFKYFPLENRSVRSVKSSNSFVDSGNRIWFMTKDMCLHVFSNDGTELKRYFMNDSSSGLKGTLIRSFVETEQFCILTDAGVYRLDRGKDIFEPIRLRSGIESDLTSMVQDAYGNLWASCGSKLVRADALNMSIIFFDLSDYLDGKRLPDNALHAAPDGHIWIGGYNGYFEFLPKERYETERDAVLKFTDVKVFGESRDWKKSPDGKAELILSYDENSLEVSYSILDFQFPQNIQYATKLEGLDRQWQVVSGVNKVEYPNLAPGNYQLRVRAAYSDRSWIDETVMKIVVRHPWWTSSVAILIYCLLGAGLAWYLWRTAHTSLKLREKVRMEGVKRQAQEDLIQYKIRFFTNISHELKTPLALIIGPLEEMMEEEKAPEQQTRLEIMHSNASRLLRMVTQIMDFGKMERGAIRLHPVDGELVGFLRKIYGMFRSEARTRDISYNFLSEWKSYVTAFDDDKVEKVVYNLISNAFKYTMDRGTVTVRLGKCILDGKEAVEIRVEDSGVGIPEEEREKIFERFYQSRTADVSRTGTGLGLSLTKDFVDMMGGKIAVTSGTEGGSVFTVMLPLEMKSYDETETEDAPGETEEGKCVLFVDDNLEMCSFMQMSLEKDYKVLVAHNGEEGLRRARKYNPDIIISDLMMPVMDGLEFCRRIKEDETTSHIPFILLTAKDGDENVYSGLQTGADAYIAKPFNMKLLKLRLENLYETRQKMQAYLRRRLKYGANEEESENKEVYNDPFVDKVVQCIKSNISDDSLDVAGLSEFLNLPKQQLYRKIKAMTGMTVVELIRSVRLEEAASRLRESSDTVSEVMYSVGFSNNSYFSKCFSEQYRMSPSDYRKQFRDK